MADSDLNDAIKRDRTATALLDSDQDTGDASERMSFPAEDIDTSTEAPQELDQSEAQTQVRDIGEPQQNYVFQPVTPTPSPSFATEGESLIGPSPTPSPASTPQYFLNPATGNYESIQGLDVQSQPPLEPSVSDAEQAALQQAGQWAGGSTVLTPTTAQDVGLTGPGFTDPRFVAAQQPGGYQPVPVEPTSAAERVAQEQAARYAGETTPLLPSGMPAYPEAPREPEVRRALPVSAAATYGVGEQGLPIGVGIGQPAAVAQPAPSVLRAQPLKPPYGTGEEGLDIYPTPPAIATAQPVAGQNYVFQPVDAQGKPIVQPAAAKPSVAQAAPQVQGGDTGVANFFVKRGDKPITSANDPRLTTVTVGGQSWQVNKEAAPAFQGFLNELAKAGAPVKALYPQAGWDNRPIAGTNKLSEHAYGGAIDVNQTLTGRNQVTDDFQKWMQANPGALEAAEKKWNIYGGERFGDLGHFEWGGVPLKTTAAPAAGATQVPGIKPLTAQEAQEQPIDIQSNGYTPGRGNQTIQNVILHSTDGSEKGDINQLTQSGKVGVQYYVTKDGRIMHFVNDADSAWQAGKDRNGNNANPYTIGIEQEHIDGKEAWPDAQVRGTAKVAAGILLRNPNLTLQDVVGHSDIAGERKQDPVDYPWDNFRRYVSAYMGQNVPGQTDQQGQVAQARPANQLSNGFYQNEDPKSFVSGRATVFATDADKALYQQTNGAQGDNGVGASRLGGLDTSQAIGLAVPEAALQAQLGNNPAAWRKARVDVVDPKTGIRMRVPIVELGPNVGADVVADMTPGLAKFFGGDNPNLAFKIVPNAGPDVTKNPQLFADEQDALRRGYDSSALRQAQVVQRQNYTFKPLDNQEQVQTQLQQSQLQNLNDLRNQYPSLAGLYKRLDTPVPGVPDAKRLDAQAQLKEQITSYAQQYYGEQDPAKAFQRALGDANFGTVATQARRNFMGYMGAADTGINLLGQFGDTNRLTTFAKLLHPEANPQQIQEFVKSITTDISDQNLRGRTIGTLFSQMEPAKQLMMNVTDVVDAADRVADPNYQLAQNAAIAKKTAWTQQQLMSDPQLQGTFADRAAQVGAQIGANALLSFLPPGARESAFAGQIASLTRADLKQAHPEWSEAELNRHTEESTLLQLVPQEILGAAIGGRLGALTAGIENPAARMWATALSHVGIGATAATAGQIGANVVAGRPAMQGAGEAAVTGGIMGLPGGLIAGATHPYVGAERAAPVAPERVAPVAPEPAAPRPVTAAQVTGPNVPDVSMPWYAPGPIITRAAERTAFTPEELSRAVGSLDQKGFTPEQLGQVIDNLQPEPNFYQQTVHLSPEGQPELISGRVQPPTPEPVPTQPPPVEKPLPFGSNGAVGEAEPWVSRIANRYTAERMVNGELGNVQPGEGIAPGGLLANGIAMDPAVRQQHIDNVANDVGGNRALQAAAVRAEEARLSQANHDASLYAEQNPNDPQAKINAQDALNAVTDFHNNVVSKLKNDWHKVGMTLQDEIPVDLSTMNGLREAYLKNLGELPGPEMEPALRKSAQQVRDQAAAENGALGRLGAEIDRQSANRVLPTDEEVRQRIMERMKDLPCPT